MELEFLALKVIEVTGGTGPPCVAQVRRRRALARATLFLQCQAGEMVHVGHHNVPGVIGVVSRGSSPHHACVLNVGPRPASV